MSQTQVVKWGNSLAVRLPKPVAERAGLKEGDPVTLESERGLIKLKIRHSVPSLKELVAQITPENRYGEIPTGRARGREEVEW